jgi:hypothetical protein
MHRELVVGTLNAILCSCMVCFFSCEDAGRFSADELLAWIVWDCSGPDINLVSVMINSTGCTRRIRRRWQRLGASRLPHPARPAPPLPLITRTPIPASPDPFL